MRMMFRSCLVVAAALCTLPAAASYSQPGTPSEVRHDGDAKFPMPAADFRQHISDHLQKARTRMEEHIADKQLPKDQADQLRAQFDAAVPRINAKVDEVCSDGTVTKEEAEAVWDLSRSLLPRHHH
jgi:hypothetical protein